MVQIPATHAAISVCTPIEARTSAAWIIKRLAALDPLWLLSMIGEQIAQTQAAAAFPIKNFRHKEPSSRRAMRLGMNSIVRAMALVASFTIPTTSVNAFGRDDTWVSGWGQGISEAVVTKGAGNQIYVTCGPGHTAVSFMLAGKAPTGSSVLLTFDHEDPEDFSIWDGRIPSDCRACAANYQTVIDKLKRHNSVHVRFENGDSARFTLKGSADAIGECTPDIVR